MRHLRLRRVTAPVDARAAAVGLRYPPEVAYQAPSSHAPPAQPPGDSPIWAAHAVIVRIAAHRLYCCCGGPALADSATVRHRAARRVPPLHLHAAQNARHHSALAAAAEAAQYRAQAPPRHQAPPQTHESTQRTRHHPAPRQHPSSPARTLQVASAPLGPMRTPLWQSRRVGAEDAPTRIVYPLEAQEG